ncbi:PREDICTED: protein NATD1, partial [Lepidothrix coronata]|uniref:Protein NATD1 n=1 Tax=Lepidothrix coronata TaxID=321398 RepID=A0A6J0HYB6_9PASS
PCHPQCPPDTPLNHHPQCPWFLQSTPFFLLPKIFPQEIWGSLGSCGWDWCVESNGGTGCHDKAVLLYEYVGKRIVDLQHTEVPDAYRGRGIAKHLAKAALDFVVEEDLKAHLTCWYIQKYVKENPLPQYLEHLQP